jgi:hypothetical protein
MVRCTRYNIMWLSLSVTCGVKHHKPKPSMIAGLVFLAPINSCIRNVNKKCVHHKIRPSISIIKRYIGNDPKINRVIPLPQGHFHMITLVLYIRPLPNLTTWLSCGRGKILFILGSKVKVTYYKYRIFDNRVVSAFPFHRGIMWPSMLKIQYTELKLSCGNDPVVKDYSYSKWPWPLT